MGSSDRQQGFRRSFQQNRIGCDERTRGERNHPRVTCGKFGPGGPLIEHAGQVLQCVMMGNIVGVAGMVVTLRRYGTVRIRNRR